jgi:DNA-binding transcriptional LysR family regulator
MDLLQHMATFVRIADSASISRAARSLGLSVAMTSRHLRGLEDHLGVELMRRTTRQLALTEAGSEFLARSRALLAGVEEAREVVRPGRGAAGLLVMSLPVSFGLAQLAPIFPALLEKHPRLEFDLRFEDRFVDLLADGVDLAIRAGVQPPDSPFVVARKIAKVERVLCAAPKLATKLGRNTSIEALASLPCIVQGTMPTHWSFETDEGPKVVSVHGRVRSNNVFAIREAVLSGLGVARMPLWIVDEDFRAKRLVRILPQARMPKIEVLGMFHRGSKGSAAIRAVLDYLQAELPRRSKMERA